MNAITKEQLENLKEMQAKVPQKVLSENGTFAYMLVGDDAIMWDTSNALDRDYTVSLRNLAPALIAAAEEGLKSRSFSASERCQAHHCEMMCYGYFGNDPDNVCEDMRCPVCEAEKVSITLRARVQELEDALKAARHELFGVFILTQSNAGFSMSKPLAERAKLLEVLVQKCDAALSFASKPLIDWGTIPFDPADSVDINALPLGGTGPCTGRPAVYTHQKGEPTE